MASVTHLIARQTVEVIAFDRSSAEALAARTSSVAGRLSALIEHLCDALDTPGVHLRFDRIVLELGACDPAWWEDALIEGVRERLDGALTAAMRNGAGKGHDPGGAALALLAGFGRTGRLPWWSEASATPSEAAATLRRSGVAPEALADLLADATTAERLVNQLDEDDLVALLSLARPDLPADAADRIMRAATGQSPFETASGGADSPVRAAVWRAIFGEVGATPARAASELHGLERLIAGVVARLEPTATAASLLARLEALESVTEGRDDRELAIVLQRTWLALPADAAVRALAVAAALHRPDRPPTREVVWRAVLTEAATAAATAGPLSPPAALERLIAGLRRRLPSEEDVVRPAPVAGDTQAMVPEMAADLASRIESLARSGGSGSDLLARLVGLAEGLDVDRVIAASRALDLPDRTAAVAALIEAFGASAAREAPDPARPTASRLRSPATRAEPDHDALAVPGAGLPLLAPFLPAFFAHLGLTGDGAFTDEAARHRAAALLHHLVTGETVVAEASLALAKLLVGLDLDAVHLPGEPLTRAEVEAATGLLEAVIGHAPALGQIGVHGLREAWLQRPGSLSTRDGSWLLRVERRTYDILIERLPWSFAWVRLPWMAAPLAVEW